MDVHFPANVPVLFIYFYLRVYITDKSIHITDLLSSNILTIPKRKVKNSKIKKENIQLRGESQNVEY